MKSICFSLFLFFHVLLLSQNQTVFENIPLKEALPKVETFYKVSFSYVDSIIEDKTVSIVLDSVIPLDDFIITLSSQTGLKFNNIEKGFISISLFSDNELITICGYLYTDDSPIENATLQVDDKFYSTNKDGYFIIKDIQSKADIQISSFGVKKVSVKALEFLYPNCKALDLVEKLELLDQVVIDEYLTSGISKNVKQTTIHSRKLKILPGIIEPDVLESIHLMPGVSNLNETVNSIHVRGGNADQNLVLWNNIKTYNNSHLFGAISAFNPYVIDKVHFINKGTSAKYGERVSSVIDIKSNYKPATKFSGGAGFNMLHGDVFVDVPILKNKLSFMVSGRRSYSDVIETFTFKEIADRIFQNTKIFDNSLEFSQTKNIFWFNDYTINAAWRLNDKNEIKVNHLFNKNYLNFSAISADNNNLYIDELDTDNYGVNTEWHKEWSDNLSHQVDVYYSQYNLNYKFSDQSALGVFENIKRNLIQDFGINTNFKYNFDDIKSLDLGYQFTRKRFSYLFQDNQPTFQNILDQADEAAVSNSIYGEYQINDKNNYLLSLGTRFNNYSNTKDFLFEPRAILQKFVTKEFSINSSVEYKSQFISQIQESVISNLSLENYVWALSNQQTLPILKSYQYTIGANYTKNKWIIDLEAYFKKIKGINSLNTNINNPIVYDYFIGNSSIQGIDLFVKKQFKNYNTWFSYSFNSAKYSFPELNNGNTFPSNLNVNNTIKWSHFYKWKNIECSLGWIWHSGKPFTQINETVASDGSISYSFSSLNDQRLPHYHRLDLSVLYSFKPHKLDNIKYRLGLSVLNVYNRNNIVNKDIRYDNSSNVLNVSDVQATGITPNLVLRIFW